MTGPGPSARGLFLAMRPLWRLDEPVMADPPWSFSTFSEKGWGKGAQEHDQCQSIADIAAPPVRILAARSIGCAGRRGHLGTRMRVPEAMASVMEAQWGFGFIDGRPD
jgi:hypothetical protein